MVKQRLRHGLIGAVAFGLACVPAGAASAANQQQQQVVDVLNRAISRVYAAAPGCKPANPFRGRSTLTDADPSAELLSTFAIFRRPATAEELSLLKPERAMPARGIYRRYARVVTSTSGRRHLVYAAQDAHHYAPRPQRCIDAFRRDTRQLLQGRSPSFRRATERALAQVIRDEWAGPAQGPTEGLFLFDYSPGGAGGGGGGAGVEMVRTRGMFFSSGGSARRASEVTGLVPDGVATVKFHFGTQRRPEPAMPGPHGAPKQPKRYARPLVRTVAVRDNVVSLRVPRATMDALSATMTWLAADGSVVRVVKAP